MLTAALAVVLIALQVADMLTSLIGFSLGLHELNPGVASLIKRFGMVTGTFIAKAVAVVFVLYLWGLGTDSAIVMLAAGVVAYSWVVRRNFYNAEVQLARIGHPIGHWGMAFCPNPRHWRFWKQDATEDDGSKVGIWWCFGPVAICYDFGA